MVVRHFKVHLAYVRVATKRLIYRHLTNDYTGLKPIMYCYGNSMFIHLLIQGYIAGCQGYIMRGLVHLTLVF